MAHPLHRVGKAFLGAAPGRQVEHPIGAHQHLDAAAVGRIGVEDDAGLVLHEYADAGQLIGPMRVVPERYGGNVRVDECLSCVAMADATIQLAERRWRAIIGLRACRPACSQASASLERSSLPALLLRVRMTQFHTHPTS
jgi:hypothetical protein